jgi:flagellar hook protein FlgE
VMSPNNMTAVDGTAFRANRDSGPVMLGYAGLDGMGTIKSGAYESSNVDIATELTDMIESQRTYTANSKVFQTGSEMFDVLNNMKR